MRPASGRNWLAIAGFLTVVAAAAVWLFLQDQRAKREALRDLNDSVQRISVEADRDLTPEQREASRREIDRLTREYEARDKR